MTAGEKELQRRRIVAQWWWLSEANAQFKCEAALAWETLKRTDFYPLLWQMFVKETRPLMEAASKPSLAGVFQQAQLIQAAREAIGQQYFDYLMGGFDPALSWLELTEGQRLKAQGFVLGDSEALKVNDEYLMPRQKAEPPALTLYSCGD